MLPLLTHLTVCLIPETRMHPTCLTTDQPLPSGPTTITPPPSAPSPGGALALAAVYANSTALVCILGFVATLVGYFAGAKYGREYSGKLFPLTFLIVGSAGIVAQNPLPVMVSRIAGILSGIAVMFVLSMVWYPRSASDKVGRGRAGVKTGGGGRWLGSNGSEGWRCCRSNCVRNRGEGWRSCRSMCV